MAPAAWWLLIKILTPLLYLQSHSETSWFHFIQVMECSECCFHLLQYSCSAEPYQILNPAREHAHPQAAVSWLSLGLSLHQLSSVLNPHSWQSQISQWSIDVPSFSDRPGAAVAGSWVCRCSGTGPLCSILRWILRMKVSTFLLGLLWVSFQAPAYLSQPLWP